MSINKNHIVVHGWMAEELGLKNNELLVYSLIYGFTQDGQQEFYGSLNYIAEWCGCSKRNVVNNLKSLLEKGYITKREDIVNGNKRCFYKCVEVSSEKSSLGGEIISPGGEESSLDYTIIDNIVDNKRKYKKKNSSLNKVLAKIEEYGFSDKVKELIVDFYSDKIESGNKILDNQLEYSLDELAQVNEELQIRSIENSIKSGWARIYIAKDTSNQQKGTYHLENEGTIKSTNDLENYKTKVQDSIGDVVF